MRCNRVPAMTLCAATLLASPGCMAVGGPGSGQVMAPVNSVVRTAERVFRDNEIPIRVVDVATGRIATGSFEVNAFWGGEPVQGRVDCGETDDDQFRAALHPVRMAIDFQARRRRNRPTTQPDVYDRERSVTSMSLRGHGTVHGDDGESHSCALTREFRDRLLNTIVARLGGDRRCEELPGQPPLGPGMRPPGLDPGCVYPSRGGHDATQRR